jgi:hypothetical protein
MPGRSPKPPVVSDRYLVSDKITPMDLTRYWFRTARGYGYGVTAYSIADAKELLARDWPASTRDDILEVVEHIDVRSLDQGHVIPNMGPPSVRGVWFPCRNV